MAKSKQNNRSKLFNIRVSEAEYITFSKEVSELKTTRSEYIRNIILLENEFLRNLKKLKCLELQYERGDILAEKFIKELNKIKDSVLKVHNIIENKRNKLNVLLEEIDKTKDGFIKIWQLK